MGSVPQDVYLGFDLSTQSLSATAIDLSSGSVLYRGAVSFGADLPAYGSPNGFLPSPLPARRHADPRMWADAFDVLLARGSSQGMDWSRVAALSGAAQQHGSIYTRAPLRSGDIGGGDLQAGLGAYVGRCLSRETAPIWMDATSAPECREIAAAAGGDSEVLRLTGSRTTERFTGPQIRRFMHEDPGAYLVTDSVFLVSAFAATLLLGEPAPADLADASGMNLLDLARGRWSERIAMATAPGLLARLIDPVPSDSVLGEISPYFVKRHGFHPAAQVVVWSGDNPTGIVGVAGSEPGLLVISLGTSDTAFGPLREPRVDRRGFGHTFGNPAGGFLGIDVHANGALAREAVRERAGYTWPQFERAVLEETEPGNGGALMLPFFTVESTPRIENPRVVLDGDAAFAAWRRTAAAARAVLEAQAMSLRAGSRWIDEAPRELLLTGGGSQNAAMQRILADVFQAAVVPMRDIGGVALGAAMRAAQAAGAADLPELARDFVLPARSEPIPPDPGAAALYRDLERRYECLLKASFAIAAPNDL